MNEQTFPARDIVLALLKRNRVNLIDLIAILAIFQMCSPHAAQELRAADLLTAVKAQLARLDPDGTISLVSLDFIPQPNTSPNARYN